MRRKRKHKAWFWAEYDRKNIDPELISEVGHLTFTWNDIEESLDRAISWVIECPVNLQIEIRSRINGLEGKVEIVKAALANPDAIPADVRQDLLTTLGAFQGYKERRDGIIHARASEITNGIARSFENKGGVYEVLLSAGSLKSLNAHLEVYQREIAAAAGVLGMFTPAGRVFAKAAAVAPITERAYQSYLKTLRDCQRQRKALPPLPEFPPESPPPEKREGKKLLPKHPAS